VTRKTRKRRARRKPSFSPSLGNQHLDDLLDQLRDFDQKLHRLGPGEKAEAITAAGRTLGWFACAADRVDAEHQHGGLQDENLARLAHAIAAVGARLDSDDNPGLAAMACIAATAAGSWLSGFTDCLRITGGRLGSGNPAARPPSRTTPTGEPMSVAEPSPDPEELFRKNEPLAIHIAKRAIHPRDGFDRADVKQEALIGLWEAAKSYEPARGRFSVWAAIKAKDRVTRYFLARANRPLRQPWLKFNDEGEEAGDATEDVEARPEEDRLALKEETQKLLGLLPARDRRIVELRFGIGDGIERSSEEVAAQLGLTRQRIDQVLQRSLERMRAAA
jgi:RNA polymerase sigma factor (sigma-70 family)